jgi:uncharacterized protein YegL
MKNSTYIALVLDRSGSIQGCLAAMQSALDEFVNVQKKEPGECDFALFQFDNVYECVYSGPLRDAPAHKIDPRGSTALHDAIGNTIDDLGAKLSAMPEAERPERVMVCIITDGLENSSHKFDGNEIAAKIKHQQEVYRWNFTFLGAHQDAIATAAAMNIPAGHSMTFVASAAGMAGASASLNSYAVNYRRAVTADMAKDVTFTDEDRKNAVKP